MRWPSERRECGGVSRLLQDTSQFSSSKKDAAGTEVREDEGTVAIVRTSRPVERPSNGQRVSFESKTRARVLFSAPPDQCFLLLLLLLFFFLFFFLLTIRLSSENIFTTVENGNVRRPRFPRFPLRRGAKRSNRRSIGALDLSFSHRATGRYDTTREACKSTMPGSGCHRTRLEESGYRENVGN